MRIIHKSWIWIFVLLLFTSCISTSTNDNNIAKQSREEKELLNNLYIFQELYYEVMPGDFRWVEVEDITEFFYNEKEQLIQEKTSIDIITYEYDSYGNKIKENHSIGNTYSYNYDENNFESACYFSDGTYIIYKNDNRGNHIYSVDSKNEERYFEYDEVNRLVHVINVGTNEVFYDNYGFVPSSPPSKEDYNSKITYSNSKDETYITYKNGDRVRMSMMKYVPEYNEMQYTYKNISEYDSNHNLVHQQDSLYGERWYAYVFDDVGKIMKKITFKKLIK
ncbi:hypothetical protein IKQ19_09875 [Candidatus Saccharibacteria bacterium]|nr:hypothetical protein [Candidatus Saccharibacteria bacterium]